MLHNRVFREFAGFEMSLAEGGVSEFVLPQEDMPSSSSFKREEDEDNLYLATFTDRAEKGLGMMTNKPLRKSTIAMTNLAAASIVIGHRKHDVCNNCYQRIPKAAKAHLECKHFQYCCRECLDDSREFISCCGDAINAIMTRSLPKSPDSFEMRQESARETQLLAMMLLYNIATSETVEEVTYRLQVFRLFDTMPGSDIGQHDLYHTSEQFFEIFNSYLPSLRQGLEPIIVLDRPRMLQLFRIIRLNAQPLPCSGMKQVAFLTILPTLARINHHCQPNTSLILELIPLPHINDSQDCDDTNKHSKRREVKVSLLCTVDIAIGQELTVSYLNNLCGLCEERRMLLEDGFYFTCHCDKCAVESETAAIRNARWSAPNAIQIVNNIQEILIGLEKNITKSMAWDRSKMKDLANAVKQQQQDGKQPGGGNNNQAAVAAAAANAFCWDIDECETSLTSAEMMLRLVKELQSHEVKKGNKFVWSPSLMNEVALLAMDDYQRRFLSLEGKWKDYVRYGLLFVRAGVLVEECWCLAGSPAKISRLDFMVNTCIHCILMAKAYADHRVHGISLDSIVTALKTCMTLAIEASVIIDSVYLTNTAKGRERESEVGLDDVAMVCDTWHYLRTVRDKAVRVRSYLKVTMDRIVKECQDQVKSTLSAASSSAPQLKATATSGGGGSRGGTSSPTPLSSSSSMSSSSSSSSSSTSRHGGATSKMVR